MKLLLLMLCCATVFVTSCRHVTVQRFNQLSMLKNGMLLSELGEDFHDGDKILKFEINQEGTVYTIVPVMVMSSRISIISFGGGGSGSGGTGTASGVGLSGGSSSRNNTQKEIGGDEFYLVFDANKKLIAGDFLYRLKFSDNTLISTIGRSIEISVLESIY